jgi:hypothetical protein
VFTILQRISGLVFDGLFSFNTDFNMFLFKHMSKLTVCMISGSPTDYSSAGELRLQLVAEEETDGQPNVYFVTDVQDFKNSLYTYPIHRICSQLKNTAQTNKEGN